MTLWELFSLGQEPYSEGPTPAQLANMLGAGRRLGEANMAPYRVCARIPRQGRLFDSRPSTMKLHYLENYANPTK